MTQKTQIYAKLFLQFIVDKLFINYKIGGNLRFLCHLRSKKWTVSCKISNSEF